MRTHRKPVNPAAWDCEAVFLSFFPSFLRLILLRSKLHSKAIDRCVSGVSCQQRVFRRQMVMKGLSHRDKKKRGSGIRLKYLNHKSRSPIGKERPVIIGLRRGKDTDKN